jgi:hypothetical protein
MSYCAMFLPLRGLVARLSRALRDRNAQRQLRVLASMTPEQDDEPANQPQQTDPKPSNDTANQAHTRESSERKTRFTQFLVEEYSAATPGQHEFLARIASEFVERIEAEKRGAFQTQGPAQ